MKVFYISYIYKPAISSHPKPGLFGMATLTLLLTGSCISLFVTSEPDLQHILEFPVSWSSWLRQFEIPDFRMFATPRLHRFKIPENRMFAIPRLRRFKIPENRLFVILKLRRFKIPENRECSVPGKHILRIPLNSTFRGWQVFLNSPTLAPRGSGLTPTIRFHENQNFGKNVTLRTSEGTRVTRKPHNGLIEASAELPPLAPINRRLPPWKFFTAPLLLLRIVTLFLRGNSSCASEFANFLLSSNLFKVLFLSLFRSYSFFLLY
jgi:hypothetical protein